MIRNLKALGLALVAMFAMSALVASSAAAVAEDKFHSEQSHTLLTGSTDTGNQVFTVPGVGTTTCTGVSGSATQNTATATEITFTPVYTGCSALLEESEAPIEARVTTTTCDYIFTGATRASGHNIVHIACTSAGDHIDVQVFLAGAWRNCLKVPPQTPTTNGVIYTNQQPGGLATRDVTLDATVAGITYTRVGVCIGAEGNNATYSGNATVKGADTDGNQVGIWFE